MTPDTPPRLTPTPPPEEVRAFGPLLFIPGRKGGRYPYCHSLVVAGAETWIIDPSGDQDYLRRLARSGKVTALFFSHYHEDHWKYRYLFPQARCFVPAQETAAFHSVEGILAFMGVADPDFGDYWREVLIRDFHFQPLPQVIPYDPGMRCQQGEIVLEILPAPGHTPGHSCFYFPHQQLLYLADVDLTPFGPWYGDATSSLEDFEASLERLKTFPAQTYLTAHEQGIFTPEEFHAGLEYFQWVIRERDRRLLAWLRTPHTLEELVSRRLVYGKPREPLFVYDHFERQMLQKHLQRLLSRGQIRRTPAGYQREESV
jgi:glyoxylase-like metal-dependent hydrolase (beta-lactamase superfamily II)